MQSERRKMLLKSRLLMNALISPFAVNCDEKFQCSCGGVEPQPEILQNNLKTHPSKVENVYDSFS